MRLITLSGVAGAFALSALIVLPTSPVAQADPTADSQCWYNLTAPAVIEMPGGGQAVSAEIGMTHCTGLAQSVRTTACVTRSGDSGFCTTKNGYVPSTAYAPGSLHGNFTATGEGCYRVRSDLGLVCVPAGPISATL